MKLRREILGELKEIYRPSRSLAFEFFFSPFGTFVDYMGINLPDMEAYHVIALGCYNIKATGKHKHVVKYQRDVKVKPEFIDQILESLREQEQD